MKILNLFCGIGGNRKLWNGHDITAVELDERVAAVYRKLYPMDTVIVGDAMAYLYEYYAAFDFIWASPPCQSHSRMCLSRKEKPGIDPMLHETIDFLRTHYSGIWVVENVRPYYRLEKNLPTYVIDRHTFWSNVNVCFFGNSVPIPTKPKNFIKLSNLEGKGCLHAWLDIHFDEIIYLGNSHCPAQILRNAVHPIVGNFILEQSILIFTKMEKETKKPSHGGKRPGAGAKKFTSQTVLIPFAPDELAAMAAIPFTRTKLIRYVVRKAAGLCVHTSVTVDALRRVKVCNGCEVKNPEDFSAIIRHFEPLVEPAD